MKHQLISDYHLPQNKVEWTKKTFFGFTTERFYRIRK